ncbi:DUF456 domain-containing protein [Brevibacterium luteolum]|uniref:DUF456 domain-containing protein n=1 Tax=Brevibacterium luteolum TaxID=199591 RepID=A0A6G8KWI4_9MICO|nr:DUF456 domain-containing protein [Brevibacterium luteolum]QIN29174.1 DUF456 domain-containing protein [Brevibacterium luteolum]
MNAEIITTVLVGLAMLIGCIGIIVPVLPGSILIAIAAIVWAVVIGTATGWVTLAVILVLVGIGMTASWVLTGKRLKARQIPNSSLVLAAICAFIGFFVIPVVGLFVGFIAGLYLAEFRRLKDPKDSWQSSWTAIKALGIGIIVEFCCAAAALTAFVVANAIYFVNA